MAADIIDKLKGLQGILLGERKRNMNILLNRHLDFTESEAFDEFKPRNYSEHILKIDVLIHYRNSRLLLKEIQTCDKVILKRILKNSWFTKDAARDIEPETLVENLFPTLCYSTKLQFLKKIFNKYDEERCDNLIDRLISVYGFSMAKIVITGCSVAKIRTILENYNCLLNYKQLKSIYDKSESLITTYFAEQSHHNTEYIVYICYYDKLFQYIALKDPQNYLKIKKQFRTGPSIGRRTSAKIAKFNKNKIDELICLNGKGLVQSLGSDFPKFYLQQFPSDETTGAGLALFINDKYLKYTPKRQQFRIYKETFQKKFKKNLTMEFADDPKILNIIPDPLEREKFAEMNYEDLKMCPFLAFYTINRSVSLLKAEIEKATSSDDRFNLLELLVQTCKINNDLDAFNDVLDYYFIDLHREERHAVLAIYIYRNFNLDQFSDQNWSKLEKLIECFRMCQHTNLEVLNLVLGFVKYLHKCGRSTRNAIEMFVELHDRCEFECHSLQNCEQNLLKYVLLVALEIKVKKQNYKNLMYYIKNVVLFNGEHPKDLIDLLQHSFINDFLESEINHNRLDTKIIAYFICRTSRSSLENELLHEFWKNITHFKKCRYIVRWFFKHDPNILLEKFEELSEFIKSKKDFCLLSEIKRYCHIDLDQKIKAYYLTKVNSGEETYGKYLAILLSPKEILEGTDLLKYARFTNYENQVIWHIFSQYSLICSHNLVNRMCYCSPENVLTNIILPYTLRFALFLRNDVNIKSFWLEKSVDSCRKVRSLNKYFYRNPSLQMWYIYSSNVDTHFQEQQFHSTIQKIHKQFRYLYWEAFWNFKSVHEGYSNCTQYDLVDCLFYVDVIKKISIARDVITYVLLANTNKVYRQSSYIILKFTAYYLMYRNDLDTFENIFQLLSSQSLHSSNLTIIFDEAFMMLGKYEDPTGFTISAYPRDEYKPAFNNFIDYWDNFFKLTDALKPYVLIKFYGSFESIDLDNVPLCSKIVTELFSQILATIGDDQLNDVCQHIINFLSYKYLGSSEAWGRLQLHLINMKNVKNIKLLNIHYLNSIFNVSELFINDILHQIFKDNSSEDQQMFLTLLKNNPLNYIKNFVKDL